MLTQTTFVNDAVSNNLAGILLSPHKYPEAIDLDANALN